MAKRENVLEKLIGKTTRPEGELEAIDRRLHENTARCFDGVLRLLLDNTGEYTKALLGGGRGSMKSSTASLGISAGLEHDEDACALVLRKVGDTLRGSVFEQMQWAIDVLGLGEHWRVTVSPMEIVNERTGQKIVFKGLDEPKKSNPSSCRSENISNTSGLKNSTSLQARAKLRMCWIPRFAAARLRSASAPITRRKAQITG